MSISSSPAFDSVPETPAAQIVVKCTVPVVARNDPRMFWFGSMS